MANLVFKRYLPVPLPFQSCIAAGSGFSKSETSNRWRCRIFVCIAGFNGLAGDANSLAAAEDFVNEADNAVSRRARSLTEDLTTVPG